MLWKQGCSLLGGFGARNNEPPIQHDDENICWPLLGSGEIDIVEHHCTHGGQTGYVGRSILPLGTLMMVEIGGLIK